MREHAAHGWIDDTVALRMSACRVQQLGDFIIEPIAQFTADAGVMPQGIEELGVGLGMEDGLHRPRIARAFAKVSSRGTP